MKDVWPLVRTLDGSSLTTVARPKPFRVSVDEKRVVIRTPEAEAKGHDYDNDLPEEAPVGLRHGPERRQPDGGELAAGRGRGERADVHNADPETHPAGRGRLTTRPGAWREAAVVAVLGAWPHAGRVHPEETKRAGRHGVPPRRLQFSNSA